jgi:heme/copper-type cytochrome/quinol oxidase subunit 3
MGHGTPSGIVQYNDKEFGTANPGKIGMWIFLVTDAMSFSGLLLAYGILRAEKGALWPDPVKALGGVGLSGFMTFLLICSSVSMVLSIDACRNKKRESMLRWLLVTILGGAAFLGIQMYEYHHLMHEMGMTFNSYAHGPSLFSSTFFSITGFHGLHVLSGVLYLIWMYRLAVAGRFDNGDHTMLEIAGLFWHFVDLVWILVFTFVYLL